MSLRTQSERFHGLFHLPVFSSILLSDLPVRSFACPVHTALPELRRVVLPARYINSCANMPGTVLSSAQHCMELSGGGGMVA